MAVERRGVKRNSTRVRSVRTGVKRRSRDEEDKQDLEQTVSNYQTRLSASGVDTDTRNPLEKLLNLPEDQNFLFDIAEIIGRPQQAFFGAIDAAQKGEDVGEAAWKGLTGEKYTTGGQLLRNAGIGDDSKGSAKITDPSTWGADDVLGLALDIFADPVDLALIPVTGGTNIAVSTAADNVKNLSKAADAAKAANTASDAAKGFTLASKAGDAADIAKVAAGLDTARDITVPIKYRETLLNYLTRQAGKGVKGAARGVDNLIELGLGKIDDANFNSIMRQGVQKGIAAEEKILESAGYTSVLKQYKDIKKAINNTFNYAKALPGNLINKARQAKGGADMAKWRSLSVLQKANQDLDDYVYNFLKAQGIDLTDLDNYIQSTGRVDIDNFLNEMRKSKGFEDVLNDPNSLYNVLYNAKNQASLDVRDLLESYSDTKVNGRTVLSNLGKKGREGVFTGSKESAEAIAKYLDSRGIETTMKVNPQGLGYDLSITVGKKGNLEAFKKLQTSNSAMQAFDNMNLRRTLGYTFEDKHRIDLLRKNKELRKLANSVRDDYEQLADIFEQQLGVDFSGITDRSGYVRRELLENNPFEDLVNNTKRGTGNVNTRYFASRKYPYPTMVTERLRSGDMSRVGETVREKGAIGANIGLNEQQMAMKNVENSIKRTQGQLSANKEKQLRETIEQLKERIENTVEPSNKELAIQERIDKLAVREQKAFDTLNETRKALDNKVIEKASANPNSKVTKTLINKTTKFGEAQKAYDNFYAELIKKYGDNLEGITLNDFNKLEKLDNALIKTAYDVQIATTKLKGSIDDSVRSLMKETAKAFTNEDSVYKELNDVAVQKQLQATQKELASSAREELNRSLTDKLKRTEDELKDLLDTDASVLAARDAKKLERIERLQQTMDVLKSKEGTKLFDDNYIAGINNFIDYASKNAAGAKIYNEALAVGTFYDDNLVRVTQDTLPKDLVPSGMQLLPSEQVGRMKAQLQSIKGILPDNTKAIDELINYLDGGRVYMDKNLVNLLNFGTGKEVNPILKLVNGFNNVFKQFSVFSPGFLFRNITGNTINLVLSGVPVSELSGLYRQAAKLLDDDYVLDIINKANLGTLTDLEKADFDLLSQFVSNGFYRAGTGVQDLGEIVTKSYNATEEPLTNFQQYAKAVGGTPVSRLKEKTIGRATDFVASANDKLDSLNRMAALIYGNKHPNYYRRLGFDNAADAVRYALFDPRNMSPTEINTIKKIIPFYTFTKQNLIYQVTNAAKNSSRYHQLIKAFDKAYDSMDEDSYRDYQKENFQLPLPFEDEDGNTIMLKMNLPVNDLTIFSSPIDVAQRFVSSTTPLIRAPFEQVSGIDMYTGQELYRSGIEQLASYLGVSNITTNVWDKIEAIIAQHNGDMNSTEMWTEIFNSLAQYNNQEKIRNSNLYEEMERYSSLVSDLKKQGIEVPTIRDLTNTGSTRLTQLQRKRNKRNNSN